MSAAPAMLGHCQVVYKAMLSKAQTDPEGNLYFEGSGTKIVQEAGLSNPYYSSVMKGLKAMDCVRQGRRGGGGMGSIWYLLQEPSEELWAAHASSEAPTKKLTKVSADELHQAHKSMMQQLARLDQRVTILEAKNA